MLLETPIDFVASGSVHCKWIQNIVFGAVQWTKSLDFVAKFRQRAGEPGS